MHVSRLVRRLAVVGAAAAAAAGLAAAAGPAQAATPQVAASTTNYKGLAFDTCSAPSSNAMKAWISKSSYRGVGIYFGGPTRSCSQPNLTASWVKTQAGRGWHFLPIYAGSQAGSLGSNAGSVGTSQASAAAKAAAKLGFGKGSVLYDDMEAFSSSHNSAVLAYLNAWTVRLHALGYKSGVYSSSGSGISLLNGHYGSKSPDVVYFAHWNGSKGTSDSFISASHWKNHQRVHQYQGGHNESHGGFTLSIDSDYMDVHVAG
jgi:hypothetical protein